MQENPMFVVDHLVRGCPFTWFGNINEWFRHVCSSLLGAFADAENKSCFKGGFKLGMCFTSELK